MYSRSIFLILFILAAFSIVLSANEIKQNSAIILQYHRFGNSKYPSTNTSLELFKKQMKYLYDNNYNVWPLSKVVKNIILKKEFPKKTVVITIDDAYKSVYKNAYPVLKKYHFASTIFVNSMPVVGKSRLYMSWSEMREMGKDGAEFANHTFSHQYLVRFDINKPEKFEPDVIKEIKKCEIKLEKELGRFACKDPKIIAYPYGEFDNKLIKIIKKLDYVGIAQNSGPVSLNSNLFRLRRFPMSDKFGGMKSFILKLHTIALGVLSTSTDDTIVSKSNNPPIFKMRLDKKYADLRCFTADGKEIKLKWISDKEVQMQSKVKLHYPRNHYTCTSRAARGIWYWYSHMWVILK